MTAIADIHAREILDSRGNPTVEVEVTLDSGTLGRAAVGVGVAAVVMETHEDPDRAPSDGPNMGPLRALPELLETLIAFDRLAKARPRSSAM